jgi:hypothetical protein
MAVRQLPLESSRPDISLATLWRRLFTGTGAARLELPGVGEEKSQLLQSIIGRHMGAYGCREGQVGITLALALFGLLVLVDPLWLHMASWTKLTRTGIGILLLCALIGKLAGRASSPNASSKGDTRT